MYQINQVSLGILFGQTHRPTDNWLDMDLDEQVHVLFIKCVIICCVGWELFHLIHYSCK